MSTTTLEPYAVVAYNSAWDSENKIHDDEVARRLRSTGCREGGERHDEHGGRSEAHRHHAAPRATGDALAAGLRAITRYWGCPRYPRSRDQ